MPRRTDEEGASGAAGGGGPSEDRLEALRRESDRLRRALLHARETAHDLAQPLTTVLARSQLLLRKCPPDHPDHRALTIICREADRLAQIVERFQTLKEMAPDPEETAPPPPRSAGKTPRSS